MNPKKEMESVPLEKLALYEQLVETIPEVDRKGASMPYTSWNGHMFSFLAKDGALALRLPRESREEFLARYSTTLAEANGAVLKEYVFVPVDLLAKTQDLKPYFEISLAHVKTLKPKSSKKDKKN